MLRREFSALVLASSLSGCVALSGGGGGYIDINNSTDTAHDVSVTLIHENSLEIVLDETFRVDANSEREIEDAFGGGTFEAEVTVDDDQSKEFELGVGRCPNTRFYIGIEPETLKLSHSVCD